MPIVDIFVKNKVATGDGQILVCGNSNYLLHFTFDEEWEKYYAKTLVVRYGNNVLMSFFTGDEVLMPVITDTIAVSIGVFSGDLETTTPAYFDCKKSIICGVSTPIPTEEIYNQIVDAINKGMLKGDTGEAAGFGEPTASVDNKVGTPSVKVTASGENTAKVFNFEFHNLKGENGLSVSVVDKTAVFLSGAKVFGKTVVF